MLYFRYRKGEELSIKGLIYNELYFADRNHFISLTFKK